MATNSGSIDPHRPWIEDRRDDPAAMNWGETLFNPFGETSKLHFTRAWTLMCLGRLGLYLIPSFTVGILGMSGMDTGALNTGVNVLLFSVPALLLPFAVFTLLTEFTSYVAHVRRLADARRPTWLAGIVLVPMILALAAYVAGTGMGAAQHRALNAPPAAVTETAPADAKSDAKTEAEAGEEAKPDAKRKRGGERRGPPGPPQSERQMAVSAGLGMALPLWALASFCVMCWTLAYVARLPNGGSGRLRMGSVPPADDTFGAM